MKQLDEMTEAELRPLFNEIANQVEDALPPKTGFILLAAGFDEPTAQYVGNIERRTGIAWMLETAERLMINDDVER